MKTIEQQIFTIAELSETAKKKAHSNYQEHQEFYWGEDWMKVIKTGLEEFNCTIGNWEVDYSCANRSHVPFTVQSDFVEEISGWRLRTWLINNFSDTIYPKKYYGKLVNTFKDGTPIPVSKEHRAGLRHVKRYSKVLAGDECNITGFCGDYDFMKPILEFIKKPDTSTFKDLIEEAIHNTLKGMEQEYDNTQSMEYFEEEAEANDMEFYEDGTRYYERKKSA